jgi:hypothetical protein
MKKTLSIIIVALCLSLFSKAQLCPEISYSIDKFSGDTTKSSLPVDNVSFTYIRASGGKTYRYMYLRTIGYTANVNKTGVIILLKGGKKIEKPNEKVEVDVNKYGDGYVYSALLSLTKEDIELLKDNDMTDYRLFIYDGSIKAPDKIKKIVECVFFL